MARSRSIGGIYASLSLKDGPFRASLKNVRKELTSFAKTGFKVGAAATAAAVPAFIIKATSAASDLAETMSKSDTVFGRNSAAIQEWAEGASRAFGQSKQGALDAATSLGNMFLAMGQTRDDAAKMSRSLVELGSDLASFNNTTPEDAIEAIGAALRGESEPIRRYGVLLDDATLKAKALAMGIYDGTGTLEPASRAMAAYQVILSQTATAQGDFAKTADGLANSQRTIVALVSDLTAEIGTKTLPMATDLANEIKSWDFEEIATGVTGAADAYWKLGTSLAWVAKNSAGGMAYSGIVDWGSQLTDKDFKNARDQAEKERQKFLNGTPTIQAPKDPTVYNDGVMLPPNNPFAEARSKIIPDLLKRRVVDEYALGRKQAMERYNLESMILTAQLKGDKEKEKSLERQKRIAEEIADLVSEGFSTAEATGPATAMVDAMLEKERRDAEPDIKWQNTFMDVNDYQRRGLSLGDGTEVKQDKQVSLLSSIDGNIKKIMDKKVAGTF